MVGVNSQIYSRSGGYMGLSFAIPADVAVKVADQIKTHGKVSTAASASASRASTSRSRKLRPQGRERRARRQRREGRPAEKAGFKAGDVIRKIDGVAMADSTDVTSRIGNTAPGTKITVEVWRDGKPVELVATVGTLDDAKVAAVRTTPKPRASSAWPCVR